jgi:hypothetical protein
VFALTGGRVKKRLGTAATAPAYEQGWLARRYVMLTVGDVVGGIAEAPVAVPYWKGTLRSEPILVSQAGTFDFSSTCMNARDHWGRSGQPRQDTIGPSMTSGPSTKVAPACSMSAFRGG